MAQLTPSSATMTRPRPFYRLHASTLVLLLPFVQLLTVLIAPGIFADHDQLGVRCDHGWPWLYLRREIVSPETTMKALQEGVWTVSSVGIITFPPGTPVANLLTSRFANSEEPNPYPDWLNGWAWWGEDESREWRPADLAADIAVAGLILMGVAALFEWRRRRHARVWQFSLGELACVVTMIACALGWWQANLAATRADAALYTKNRSMRILPTSDANVSLGSGYCGPEWLRHFLGVKQRRLFERTTTFEIDKWTFAELPAELTAYRYMKSVKVEKVFEAESLAAWLASTPSIEEVEACPIRHSAIEILSRTGKMTSFDLCGWLTLSVKDADLAALPASPRLQKINLSRSDVTDDGMRYLAELSDLRELVLLRTKVTDVGVARLTPLRKLERLSLAQTSITDQALLSVAKMKRLNELDLQGSLEITGAGLSSLTSLKHLAVINLGNTHLDEQDLARLKPIQSLRELRITTGQITPAAQKQLQQALPECKIVNSW